MTSQPRKKCNFPLARTPGPYGLLLSLFILLAPSPGTATGSGDGSARPEGLARLVQAYPGKLCGARANTLVWCDGTGMVFDDGKKKSFEKKLVEPDLEDQMSQEYPRGWSPPTPPNLDPGRIRHLPFFKKMYGSTADEVRAGLKTVTWLPGVAGNKIRVTSVNGVDKKLSDISSEILRLDRGIARKVRRVSGAFRWRKIAGTRRLSPHSFGIAVDIGVEHSDYWRWTKPGPDGLFRFSNRFPLEVVEIFERHGFIWGGKWYHFDSMHFEYRPELAFSAPRRKSKDR